MRLPRNSMAGSQTISADDITALIPPRDYSELHHAESQLRVWLPEPAKLALEEICEIQEMSMTAYLTEYFTSYLFGYHELLLMRATETGLYVPRRYCAMSVSGEGSSEQEPESEPNLGKNIFALKIWVPEMIKDGLRKRADMVEVTLGEFLRALICSHLFGREYGPKRLMAMADASLNETAALSWETTDDD